jgi:hypothetical protein
MRARLNPFPCESTSSGGKRTRSRDQQINRPAVRLRRQIQPKSCFSTAGNDMGGFSALAPADEVSCSARIRTRYS